MHRSHRTVQLAACAAGVWTALTVATGVAGTRTTIDATQLQSDYRAVQAALARGTDGDWRPAGEKPPVELLARAWELASRALVRFLDGHPDADRNAVAAFVEALNPPDEAPVGSDSEFDWEARERYRLHGRVLTFHERSGRTHLVALTYGLNDEETRWVALHEAAGRHRVTFAGGHALPGTLIELPATPSGHPRFFAHHVWVKMAGCCSLAKIGIWEWDGAKVVSRFTDKYPVRCGADGARLVRGTLQLDTVPALRHMGSTCASTEMRAVRTLTITPDGIRDRGLEWAVPEFALLDDLLSRIAKGTDASALASPEVIQDLRRALRGRSAADIFFPLAWGGTPAAGEFHFAADGGPVGELSFQVELDADGRRRFRSVRIGERHDPR